MGIKHIAPVFNGEVRNGRLAIRDKARLERWVKSLEGKNVQLTVKPAKRTRTLSQNAYYWAVVVAIPADHFGYTPKEMHEAFKLQFLRLEVQGKPPTVRSTSNMTTLEMSEYIETIRRWLAAEYEIIIPDPQSIEV